MELCVCYDVIARAMDDKSKLQPLRPADRKRSQSWEDIMNEASELIDLQAATAAAASAKARAAL